MKVLLSLIAIYMVHVVRSDTCYRPTRQDSSWAKECRQGDTVSQLRTRYLRNYHDRTWKVCCREVSNTTATCTKWVGYGQDALHRNFDYNCPSGSYINGIQTLYNDSMEDRRFGFKCCQVLRSSLTDCKMSTESEYKKIMRFTVEKGRVLVGVKSSYCPVQKDRKFQFRTCAFQ